MEQDEQYKTGFNNGYLLAQHKESLLKEILQQLLPDNDYFEGLKDGKEQLDLDKEMQMNKGRAKEGLDIVQNAQPMKPNVDKGHLPGR